MTNDRRYAASAIVFALCAVAAAGRLAQSAPVFIEEGEPALGEPLFCAGVRFAGGEAGFTCAASRDAFVAGSASAGLIPEACARVALPEETGPGDLVLFGERGGVCVALGIGSLPAAAALLAGARLDVNRAARAELELLPGIGPARAEAIADSRRRDGPFVDADDLERVPGIGPKTVERLRPWIRCD